ncbi:MAG: hypothetical protein AAF432_14975 [Planctomycetota bacterium]
MARIGALLGGILAGALGIFLWLLPVQVLGYEIGVVAWGIGLLVGLGVTWGHRGRSGGLHAGIVAVAITACAVGASMVLSVELLTMKSITIPVAGWPAYEQFRAATTIFAALGLLTAYKVAADGLGVDDGEF